MTQTPRVQQALLRARYKRKPNATVVLLCALALKV